MHYDKSCKRVPSCISLTLKCKPTSNGGGASNGIVSHDTNKRLLRGVIGPRTKHSQGNSSSSHCANIPGLIKHSSQAEVWQGEVHFVIVTIKC